MDGTPLTSTQTAVTIDEQDIQAYERDGAICVRGLFAQAWVDLLRAATERAITRAAINVGQDGGQGRFVGTVYMWQQDPDFRAFVFESAAWAVAKTFMRSRAVRLFMDQVFVKEPRTLVPTPWHHDQTYWPVLGDHVCSIWVALDPITRQTGGLEYIKGSHRWGQRFAAVGFGEAEDEAHEESATEKVPDIESQRDRYEFLSWDLSPGDCLVHHSLTLHAAGGNHSSSLRRRAYSTRWLGDLAYFRPHGLFSPEVVGLAAGAPMTSDMFPLVPPVPYSA